MSLHYLVRCFCLKITVFKLVSWSLTSLYRVQALSLSENFISAVPTLGLSLTASHGTAGPVLSCLVLSLAIFHMRLGDTMSSLSSLLTFFYLLYQFSCRDPSPCR